MKKFMTSVALGVCVLLLVGCGASTSVSQGSTEQVATSAAASTEAATTEAVTGNTTDETATLGSLSFVVPAGWVLNEPEAEEGVPSYYTVENADDQDEVIQITNYTDAFASSGQDAKTFAEDKLARVNEHAKTEGTPEQADINGLEAYKMSVITENDYDALVYYVFTPDGGCYIAETYNFGGLSDALLGVINSFKAA